MAEKWQDSEKSGTPQGAAFVAPRHLVERAAGEFRRGVPLRFHKAEGDLGDSPGILYFAAETISDTALEALSGGNNYPIVMLLTSARASTLKINLYTPDVVGIELEPGVDAKRIRAIADPASDLAEPLKGPFRALRRVICRLLPGQQLASQNLQVYFRRRSRSRSTKSFSRRAADRYWRSTPITFILSSAMPRSI